MEHFFLLGGGYRQPPMPKGHTEKAVPAENLRQNGAGQRAESLPKARPSPAHQTGVHRLHGRRSHQNGEKERVHQVRRFRHET